MLIFTLFIFLVGVVTGIVFQMFYQWDKTREMKSRALIGSLFVLRDGTVGRLVDFHRDFNCPDHPDNEIAYDVRLFESGDVQHVHEEDVELVVEPKGVK